MFKIIAMSKISTLKYKNKTIDVSIREKLGRHTSPYIVIKLQDGSEAHITIREKEVFDSDIKKADILNFVKTWIDTYHFELEASWKAALKGKALKVPSEMPRHVEKKKTKSTVSTFKVRKIKELRTNKKLQMLIRFDNNEIRLVDFKTNVIPYNTAFKILTNPKIFMTAKPYGSAVLWEKEDIDIEASDLYDVSYAIELPNIKFA